MTPGQVRQLEQGTALVMATGRPVAWVKTVRSFERPDAAAIAEHSSAFYDHAYSPAPVREDRAKTTATKESA